MKPESNAASWLKFFIDAGIPVEYAENYAVTFSKHQIQLDMLPEINKEYLLDMGITVFGHVIAILRHGKNVYADTVKKNELQLPTKKQGTNGGSKEKSALKYGKTTSSNKVSSEDDKPTTPPKRKSAVVQLNTTNSSEPKSKVRKKLCDSSDDITLPVVAKAVTTPTTNIGETSADEMKKGVFRRLGSEVSQQQSHVETPPPPPAQINSSNDSVFSRLGGKTNAPQVVKVAAITPTKRIIGSKEEDSSKSLSRKSIIRTRLDKPTNRIFVSPTYMDSILEERSVSSSVNNSRDIKARLGLPTATSVNKQSSFKQPAKKVSFGSVYQKIIPREKKPVFHNPSFRSDSLNFPQKFSIGASSMDFDKFSIGASPLSFISKKHSIGASSGVFSRLGV